MVEQLKNPALPAGIEDENSCELFVKNNKLFAFYKGMAIPFSIVKAEIQENFHKEFRAANVCSAIIELFPNVTNEKQAFTQWLACNFGGFDNTPDYTHEYKNSECWDCGRRGHCPAEGIVCRSHSLSGKQIEIVRLIAEGLPDKLIADKLNISENTVKTHTKRIREKLQAHNRIDIMRYAIDNNYRNS